MVPVPLALALAPIYLVFPSISLVFLPARAADLPLPHMVSACKQVKPFTGPLTSGFSGFFHLTQMVRVPPVFTAGFYEDSYSWDWNPGLEPTFDDG